MKKISIYLSLLLLTIFTLVSCSKVITYQFINDGFNDVVTYDKSNTKVQLDGLYIKSSESQDLIPVTYDMVSGGGDTNSVGLKELVLSFNGYTQTFNYTVYYRVDYLVNGSVIDTQYIINKSELKEPDVSDVIGFVAFEELPTTITDNLEINAIIKQDNTPDTPNINNINATYGETLADIKLPSNSLGKWQFDDPLTTTVGKAGKNSFAVTFIPNDPLMYKEIHDTVVINVSKQELAITVEETNFTYTGQEISLEYKAEIDDVLLTTSGTTKATNAGEYTAYLEIDDDNYSGKLTVNWTINKANLFIKLPNLEVTYDKINTITVPKFETETTLDQSVIDTLNINISIPRITNTGDYQYEVEFNNNPNINIEVEGGKITVKPAEINVDLPTITTELHYGDTLTNDMLSEVSSGEWIIENGPIVLNKTGKQEISVTFKPDDTENYEEIKGTITINVLKKQLEFKIPTTTFIYNPNGTAVKYNLEGIVFNDSYPKVLGNELVYDVGVYEKTLIIDDENYSGQITVSLVINKADPIPNIPTVTATYNQKLSEVSLPNDELGTWEWQNKNITINSVGMLSYNAIYTPSDLKNYNVLNTKINIEVEKADNIISIEHDKLLFFAGEAVTLGNINMISNETDLIQEIYLNNNAVNNYNEEGKYLVKLNAKESTNYKQAKEVIIEVYVINKPNNISLTYEKDLSLNAVALPNSNYGKWIWNEDVLLNFGFDQTYQATFIIDDELSKTAEVTLNISKKRIEINIVQDEFIYNGNILSVIYELSDDVEIIESNISNKDVGKYTYELRVDNPNYDGYYKGTLIINKANLTINVTNETITYGNKPELKYTLVGINYDNEVKIDLSVDGNLNDEDYYDVDTYDILATTSNDSNYNIVINKGILTVEKANLADSEITDPAYDLTYGDTVSPTSFTTNQEGHWTIENEVKLDSSNVKVNNDDLTTEVKLTYIPNNKNYNNLERILTLNISKKTVTINITENTFDYNGESHNIQYEVSGNIDNYYEINGNTSYVNAGNYDITLTLMSNYYVAEEINTTLIINGVDYTPTLLPENASFVWNEDLSINDYDLSKYNNEFGSWQIVGDKILEIGSNHITLEYIPTSPNYNHYIHYIDIIVSKAEANIKANREYIFMLDDEYLLDNIITNHNEKEPKYEIKNSAGMQEITITLPESEHYKEASCQTKVYILNKTGVLLNNNYREYSDKLSDLVLPKEEFGEWSFADSNVTFTTMGENYYQAIFKLNDSKLTYKYDVLVNVIKKDISDLINILQNRFTYNATSHQVLFEVEGLDKDNIIFEDTESLKNYGSLAIDIKVSDSDSYYRGSKSITLYVDKADLTINVTNGIITYGTKAELKYTLDGTNYNDEVEIKLSVEGNLNDKGYYDVDTYDISATTSNDSNYNIVVNKGTLTVEKANLSNVVSPTINPITYGTLLNDNMLIGEDNRGTWSIDDKDIHYNAGNNNYINITLISHNSNYNDYKTTINLVVNKKELTIEIIASEFNYDGNSHNVQYKVTGMVFDDNAPQVSGNELITNVDESKELTLTIDTDNYYATKVVELTIKPVDPTPTLPTNLSATHGDKLSDVKLDSFNNELGHWEWVNGEETLDLNDNKEYEAVYTPSDTTNYNTITKMLSVNIGKRSDASLTYIAESITLINLGTNLVESIKNNISIVKGDPSSLKLEYYLNNESVESIIDNGTYKVKAYLDESDYYLKSGEIEFEVIVVNGDVQNHTYEGIYGDALNSINIPTSSEGVWSWKEPTKTLGKPGIIYYYELQFIANGSSEVSNTITVEVKVKERPVTINVNDKEVTYNKTEYQLDEATINALANDKDKYEIKMTGNDRGINAGTYTATYQLISEYYKASTVTATLTINPKKVIIASTDITVKFNETPENSKLLENGIITGDDLKIEISKPTYDKIGDYNFIIKYDEKNTNYDVTLKPGTLHVIKGDLSNVVNPTINSITYGTLLKDDMLIGKDSRGTWSIDDKKTHYDVDNHDINITLISNDSNYNDYKTTIKLVVNRKELTIEIITSEFNYDGDSHSIQYNVTGMAFDDVAPNVSGNESIINVDESKDLTLTIDTDNYYAERKVKLTIKPIDPTPTLPTNLSGTYGDKLSAITLQSDNNGSWEWVNSEEVIDTAKTKYQAKYKPTSSNYNEKVFEITINVGKALSNITTEKDYYIYEYDGYTNWYNDLRNNIKSNNNETTIEFSEKNLLNVGLYTITLSQEETNNYSATEKTIYVIVREKLNTIDLTFGDKYSDIKLNSEVGKYIILETGLIDINTTTVKAKFVANINENYTEEVTLNIKVNKRTLQFTYTETQTLDYNNEAQTFEYTATNLVDGYDLPQAQGANSYKDAGDYNISLTFNNEYYEGKVSGKLIINKLDVIITGSQLKAVYSPDYQPVIDKAYEISGSHYSDLVVEVRLDKEYTGAGSYVIIVSADNGNYNITLNNGSLTVDKAQYEIAKPSLSITYGDYINNIKLPENTEGKWEITSLNEQVLSMTLNIALKFIPDDENYDFVDMNVEVEVLKRTVEIIVTSDLEVTYSNTSYNFDYEFSGVINNDKPNVIISPNQEFDDAGEYQITLTIDSPYYVGSTSVTLKINKAKPSGYTTPHGLSAKSGTKVSSIDLTKFDDDNGNWSFKNLEQVISSSNNSVVVVYTPEDKNYKTIEETIIITIEITETVIESQNKVFVFMQEEGSIDLYAKLIETGQITSNSSNEFNFSDRYLSNAGKYEITISQAANSDYTANSITVSVYIIEYVSALNATYGDKLTNIVLPQSSYGTWSWEDSNTDINDPKTNSYNAIFTLNDNASLTTFKLKVNINKRTISLENLSDSYTYDGELKTVTYTPGNIMFNDEVNITGNVSNTEAGRYPYNLSLIDDRYELDKSYIGNLVISQANLEIRLEWDSSNGVHTVSADTPSETLLEKWFDRNSSKQLSVNYSLYFAGTDTLAIGQFKLNNTTISNTGSLDITTYGGHNLVFNIDNSNYNEFSYTATFNIFIARVTTSTTNITALDAVFNDQNSSIGYTSLDEAILDSANLNGQWYIYLYGDATLGKISSNLEIKTNVELFLPHAEDANYELYEADSQLSPNRITSGENDIPVYNSPTVYLTLTILNNVNLTVRGRITVGGMRSSSDAKKANNGTSVMGLLSDSYSQIVLEGRINVYETGIIWAIGKIVGNGEIEVNANASVYEPFTVDDWRGGSVAAGMYGGPNGGKDKLNNAVPFNKYTMHSIETKITIQKDANYIGIASIFTPTTGKWNSTNYKMIGHGAILEIDDGKIVKTFADNESTFNLYGSIHDNHGELPIEVLANVEVPISTKYLYFALSYNVNIIVKSGARFIVNQLYKMLPGSSVIIEEGATVDLIGELIVYKDWSANNNYFTNLSGEDLDNPSLIIDGTLNVLGYFAGIATSTKNGILNLSESTGLDIIAKDGTGSFGVGDIIGGIIGGETGEFIQQTYQHLYAYNSDALNIKVKWENITTSTAAPIELDQYRLEKLNYVWNDGKWIVNKIIFNSNVNISIEEISLAANTKFGEEVLPYQSGQVIEVNGVFYSLEGWYTDPEYQQRLTTMIMPPYSIELYANWILASEEELVTLTYRNLDGSIEEFTYAKGSSVQLIKPNKNVQEIYGATYYKFNDKFYTFMGYKDTTYALGDVIMLNSDLVIEYDYKEAVLNQDYFEITIIGVIATKSGWTQKSEKKEEFKTILVANNYNLDISLIEGKMCYTDYDYVKGSTGIFGGEYGTVKMKGDRTLLVNANSQRKIYFDGGKES